MTASQNGWRVLDRAECVTIDVPGGQLAVHPRIAAIFADVALQWHRRVEPLQWPGCWGHAVRPIKGSTLYSNHSSGTAIDLCAPRHPQGVPVAHTFTPEQLAEVADLEARYRGVLTWGGRWTGSSVDGMHWEVTKGVSTTSIDALARRLAAGPTPPPAPPPTPPAPVQWTGPDLRGTGAGLRGEQGANGPRVQAWQRWLNTHYPGYSALATDGVWGSKTTAVNRQFGHRSGIPSADGRNIGPRLAAAYFRAGLFRSLSAAQARAVGHVTRGARR